MASLYGADPVRFGVLSPRLGCDLETISSRLSHVFPVLVNVVEFYAIYTTQYQAMGCYRRLKAGVAFAGCTAL